MKAVSSFETQITSLQSVEDYMFVDFTIPQSVAPSLQPGQVIRLIAQDLPLNATILALDSRTDKLTRNVMVRARIDNAPSYVQPGDSVRVQIEYGDENPGSCYSRRGSPTYAGGSARFLSQKMTVKDSFEPSNVWFQVVKSIGNEVALLSGVKSGERVVTIGSFK